MAATQHACIRSEAPSAVGASDWLPDWLPSLGCTGWQQDGGASLQEGWACQVLATFPDPLLKACICAPSKESNNHVGEHFQKYKRKTCLKMPVAGCMPLKLASNMQLLNALAWSLAQTPWLGDGEQEMHPDCTGICSPALSCCQKWACALQQTTRRPMVDASTFVWGLVHQASCQISRLHGLVQA